MLVIELRGIIYLRVFQDVAALGNEVVEYLEWLVYSLYCSGLLIQIK